MPEEKLYIGCKIIGAYQLSECNFLRLEKGEDTTNREDRPGYLVKYPDGYVSWSPKGVFESAYRLVDNGEKSLFNNL